MTEEPPPDAVPIFSKEDIRRALQILEHEAAGETNPDIAGAKRQARLVIERELFGDGRYRCKICDEWIAEPGDHNRDEHPHWTND